MQVTYYRLLFDTQYTVMPNTSYLLAEIIEYPDCHAYILRHLKLTFPFKIPSIKN